MRILIGILSELSHEGRQERMVASLEKAGHEVAITRMKNGEGEASAFWQGRRLIELENRRQGRRKLYFLKFMRWFMQLIQAERPDLVLAVDPPALAPAQKARGSFRLVYDAREHWAELPTVRDRLLVRRYWEGVEDRGLRRADAAFTVCGSIAAELSNRSGRQDISLVRNVPAFSWEEDRSRHAATLRERFQLPAASKVIVYAGGFWPGYEFRPLMKAIEAMPEDVHLLMLGDGPGRQDHLDYRDTSAAGSRLHLPGKVASHELDRLLKGADAGTILTPDLGLSYRFLLPNKLFEYIQAGLPVLASPLPELSAVIAGRQLGRLVDPVDSTAIAHELSVLLEEPDKWQHNLREAARELCWEEEERYFLKLVEGV